MYSEPSFADIDALVGPATPHFALQIRDRLDEIIAELPAGSRVRRYAEERRAQMEELGLHGGRRVTNTDIAHTGQAQHNH